jgi:hypothetical protein
MYSVLALKLGVTLDILYTLDFVIKIGCHS